MNKGNIPNLHKVGSVPGLRCYVRDVEAPGAPGGSDGMDPTVGSDVEAPFR